MRRGSVLLFFMLIWACGVKAYSDKNVILLAGKITQKDTIGYNMVTDMSKWMYEWINRDTIILWDSPEKKYRIQKADLEGIERSTNTSFRDVENLFIYEVWSSGGKKTRCRVKGISFAGIDDKGEEVLYGYVEYSGTLRYLMNQAPLTVNANGDYGKTLLDALLNKEYDFDVIYFSKSAIQDVERSQKLKNHALNSKKRLAGKSRVPQIRKVEYIIENTTINSGDKSLLLCKTLEDFFNQNKQEFFNYGGDKILSFLKQSPVIISKIHVVEQWEKGREGVKQTPLEVVPYILGMPISPVPVEAIQDWNLACEGMPFVDELIRKQFNYTLHRVNQTVIQSNGLQVKEALLFKNWDIILQTAKK